ncbi:hypothetical protein [Chitinophaga sp.]|uniref:hypothetical protein n=1 Tax=Chitinophaga sp. TaxID=1869181 RepID=UPI0026067B57|nr:hypothetical protein [uncultured Chitinophaga sp.]
MEQLRDMYFDYVVNATYRKIESEINPNSIPDLVEAVFLNKFINTAKTASFHKIYLSQAGKIHNSMQEGFINKFAKAYSLTRGIKAELRAQMESQKYTIVNLIEKSPFEAYTNFFMHAKFNDEDKERNLASFFTKLAHTVNPNEYYCLDSYVRVYFKLHREGFFYSYCIIGAAYKKWIADNKPLLRKLRHAISSADKSNALKISELTDLKLLDMIFWAKGDTLKKEENDRKPNKSKRQPRLQHDTKAI